MNVIPLRLVKSAPASADECANTADVVRCLRVLLERAERGEIVGLSYAVKQADTSLFVSAAGESHRDPATGAALASGLWYDTMQRLFNEV